MQNARFVGIEDGEFHHFV